jgi:hypothetical protein
MRRLTIALAVAAALALVPAALAAAGPLDGTYKTTIKKNKLFGTTLDGVWTLKIKGANYKVFYKHKLQDRGVAVIAGTTIGLKDTGGPGACKGAGTYKFALSGKKLKFTKVSDADPSCAGRVFILKHPFKKVA